MNLLELRRHLNATTVKGRYPNEIDLPWKDYCRIFDDICSLPTYDGNFWVERDLITFNPEFPPTSMMVMNVLVRPRIEESAK